MSLQAHFPVIDDRKFQDLVDEARARIPRYTPEWTDHNENDPGFVLTELFAWLTEMQIYRMSKVPKLNYLKFLELLGIELEAARPAHSEVIFPVRGSYAESYVIVPAATQIATQEPDDQGPVVFETQQALTALKARLDRLQSYDGFTYRDLSAENEDFNRRFDPFSGPGRKDASLLMGFDAAEPFPEVSFSLTVWTADDNGRLKSLACKGTDEPAFSGVRLTWEYWGGRDWKSLNLLKDETDALTRSGQVQLRSPPKGQMVSRLLGKVPEKRYWIRARMEQGVYQEAPRVLAVRTNVALVVQAETIEAEVLGASDGSPDQVHELRYTPVLSDSLQLQVDEGEGFKPWQQASDFFSANPDSAVFVLNRATGEVRFGDGVNGRIPVANARRPANILAEKYLTGGGTRGNVDAAAITAPLSSLEGIDVAGVFNPYAAYGGADEERIESAMERAPQLLKSSERAVTSEDFELHAIRSGNIARAKALMLHHPDFPGVEVPGVVSVIVIPNVEGEAPMPTSGTLRTVCAYLDQRRLATTELYVIPPSYREIRIEARLVADLTSDLAEVKRVAEASLSGYFHPLSGGEDSSHERAGTGWPFGRDIYYSRVSNRLLVEGVDRIAELRMFVDGEEQPECRSNTWPWYCTVTRSVTYC